MTSGNKTRCDFCNNELIAQPRARKDKSGMFYSTRPEYYMPYKCPFCGGYFCDKHRLPENHKCKNMPSRYRNTAYKEMPYYEIPTYTDVKKMYLIEQKKPVTTFDYNPPPKDYSKLGNSPKQTVADYIPYWKASKKPSLLTRAKNRLTRKKKR
jgi:hypothetical protein